ncbi:dynamin family protein [Succinimonas sp.]|uniref:dynamin family protein n=1 Tax=Succinimonas sp. TaxID=1936151 RepID=UPI003863A439
MKCVEVDGKNVSSDIELINGKLEENSGVVFIYTGTGTIYDYIHALYDDGHGLNDEALYKFKVCYANDKLNITVITHDGNGRVCPLNIASMKQLLEKLDGKTACRIVVNSDKREELAFIVQQLIYIQYPLEQEKFEILLRQEEIDADKIKRFKQRVDDLTDKCAESVDRLDKLFSQTEREASNTPSHEERLSDTKSALECCKSIRKNLDKARMVELKLAVAATKKTGKSVVVNSVIGEELAPTDVQLATPNNCIYQKSRDNKYRMWMEGDKGKVKEYDSSKEIWKDIEKLFRSAQNDTEHDFVLPDMHIEYCAPGNNFSSYTIYDTPGPDAAGTDHKEPARRAINKCDVVVFCLDYSKYLTDSEESYLKEVKDIFEAQQKFHSLIFALNKIDTRYQDSKKTKSIVGAVDFVKTRLARIGDEYRDCIIFPTSSLEYFNAVESENSGVTELSTPISSNDLKKVKFAHKNVPVLAWLHGHSENLEYYHGIEEFSYDVFKQDSGMPALMSYVSYVATSKAREEILNHVAYDIEQQKVKLNTILNTVSNLEALIKADNSQIREIERILVAYKEKTEKVLTPKILDTDLEKLPVNSFLRKKYKGNFDSVRSIALSGIKTACDKKNIAEMIYSKMVQKIWKNLQQYSDKKIDDCTTIDYLFSDEDIDAEIQTCCREISSGKAKDSYSMMIEIKGDMELIGNNRQQEVQKITEWAKNELKKQNVNLLLPELPKMQFSSEMRYPDMTGISVHLGHIEFYKSDLFDFSLNFWGSVKNVLFGDGDLKFKAKIKDQMDRDYFQKLCDSKMKADFKNMLYEGDIHEKMQYAMENVLVDGYLEDMITELKETFGDMLKVQLDSIKHFRSIIDDRDKYKQHIEQQTARKDNIHQIQQFTKEFADIWNVIVPAVASA